MVARWLEGRVADSPTPFLPIPRPAGVAHVFCRPRALCHPLARQRLGSAAAVGIAPDLRFLPLGDEGDEVFMQRIRKGAVRDGRVYMPPFEGTLSQEAMWAIRTWLETVHED